MMERIEQARLDELRLCKLPTSWMSDAEVLLVLNEIAALRAELAEKTAEVERVKHACHECDGTGEVDSGGTDERGRFINCPCSTCERIAELKQQLAAEQAGRKGAERLVGRASSLARWILTYNGNGQIRLGCEDIAYLREIERDAANWLPAEEGGGG